MEKKYIVYCHENKINNKKYVGITSQKPNYRFKNGDGYKGSPIFYNAIQKYGWDSFEHTILFKDLTEDEAKAKEIELIKELHTRYFEYGYNITPGGDTCSGKENPQFGKSPSVETRQKISKALTGRIVSEETRKKQSEALKGRIFSEETKRKMRENHADFRGSKHPNYGKKIPPERHKKMVELAHSPEAIKKMKQHRVWYSGEKNPNAKQVICLDTNKVYNTVNEAAFDNGCSPSKVSAVINGHRKHTKNLHFAFYKED